MTNKEIIEIKQQEVASYEQQEIVRKVLENTKEECNASKIPLTYAEECILIAGLKEALSLKDDKIIEMIDKEINWYKKSEGSAIAIVKVLESLKSQIQNGCSDGRGDKVFVSLQEVKETASKNRQAVLKAIEEIEFDWDISRTQDEGTHCMDKVIIVRELLSKLGIDKEDLK